MGGEALIPLAVACGGFLVFSYLGLMALMGAARPYALYAFAATTMGSGILTLANPYPRGTDALGFAQTFFEIAFYLGVLFGVLALVVRSLRNRQA